MKQWLASAWLDIQRIVPNWKFLHRSTEWSTVAGHATYTPRECGIQDGQFGFWEEEPRWRVRRTSDPNQEWELLRIPQYTDWYNLYQRGATRTTTGMPTVYAIAPDKSVCLGMVPEAGYTIRAEYYRAPQQLVHAGDIPDLPSWHDPMIIVYRAMMWFGRYRAASEVYEQGMLEYRRLLNALMDDQVPKPYFA